ncbi:MAG: hypothetical protein ABJC66_07920 [Gammaproteobacteria bacterium]
MKRVSGLAAIVCISLFSCARAGETPPLQFVSEYLREFSAIERIRLAEEQELQAARQSMLAICIESGNRYRREIAQQTARMQEMTVLPPSQALPARLVELYGQKLELYTEVVNTCTALKANASTSVGYLEVMSVVSQYSAKVDAIDRSLFNTSTDAYSTLLKMEQGPHDFPRRLGITTAEKQTLLRQIDREFGAELQEDQQTYLVNAATVIRNAIRKHKALDEN